VIGLSSIDIANVDLALTCKVKATCGREIEGNELGLVVSSAFYLCKECLQQEMNVFCSQLVSKMFKLKIVGCNEM
jgi:hypothetical protein